MYHDHWRDKAKLKYIKLLGIDWIENFSVSFLPQYHDGVYCHFQFVFVFVFVTLFHFLLSPLIFSQITIWQCNDSYKENLLDEQSDQLKNQMTMASSWYSVWLGAHDKYSVQVFICCYWHPHSPLSCRSAWQTLIVSIATQLLDNKINVLHFTTNSIQGAFYSKKFSLFLMKDLKIYFSTGKWGRCQLLKKMDCN